MSYKIAVATSDGVNIDETFGLAKSFIIYEVTDGKAVRLEERVFNSESEDKIPIQEASHEKEQTAKINESGECFKAAEGCISQESREKNGECGSLKNCGSGGGCGGGNVSAKVELISDCRCVVCKKIGFHIQKQLERKAVSAFDVGCSVEEALSKISYYFSRVDNHKSLRVQK